MEVRSLLLQVSVVLILNFVEEDFVIVFLVSGNIAKLMVSIV